MLPRLCTIGGCHPVAVLRHPRAPGCVQAGVGGPVAQLLEQNLAILFQYKQNMAAYKVRPSLLPHQALLLPGRAHSGETWQQRPRLPGWTSTGWGHQLLLAAWTSLVLFNCLVHRPTCVLTSLAAAGLHPVCLQL